MKKPVCVEFSRALSFNEKRGHYTSYGWRLRATNGQIILTPHEWFISHRNAVESFRRICNALDARGPWQIKDLEGVHGSHAMLIGK